LTIGLGEANEQREPLQRAPDLAAGLADHIWTCEENAHLLD
jgi:hypothetical protein